MGALSEACRSHVRLMVSDEFQKVIQAETKARVFNSQASQPLLLLLLWYETKGHYGL